MNKILLGLIGLVLLVSIGGAWYYLNPRNKEFTPTETYINLPTTFPSPTPISYFTASFAIFTNGIFRIFTDPKYHNQSADIYIQSDNPNIVYVKKANLTWDDFFKTLPMKLEKDCLTTGTKQTFCNQGNYTLKFYLNGKKVDNLLTQTIKPNDQALITYGAENEIQINNQLDRLRSISD